MTLHSATPEQAARQLHIYDYFEEDASGNVSTGSVAEWQSLPAASSLPAADPWPAGPRTDATVDAWMAAPSSAPSTVSIVVLVSRSSSTEYLLMTDHLTVKTLDGTITTYGDLVSERDVWISAQQTDGAAALAPVETHITGLGGTVTHSSDYTFALHADVDPHDLASIKAHSDVVALLSPDGPLVPDAGYSVATYAGRADGHQSADQSQLSWFYANGFTGELDGEKLALMEGADCVNEDHPGFLTSTGDKRLRNCWGTGLTCSIGTSTCPTPVPPDWSHATRSASMLIGSIMEGTDTGISCTGTQCDERSWAARGAEALYLSSGSSAPEDRWRDVILYSLQDDAVDDLMLYSQSTSVNASDCGARAGTGPSSINHDRLFAAGVAQFVSDRNRGHAPTAGCLATAPSTAMGTFSVGAASVEETTEAAARLGQPSATAADAMHLVDPIATRGGTASGRTVKDLASSGGEVFFGYDSILDASGATQQTYPNYGASSGATPYVAGAAAIFRGWWLDTRSNRLIDDPGILYANLLLMGDRSDENIDDPPIDVGYSDVAGAGLFRARSWGKPGLDRPAFWQTGRLCVVRNHFSTIDLVGYNPIHTDVDTLTFVSWVFDPEHIAAGTFADVDVQIREETDEWDPVESAYTENITSDSGTDNKKRVVHQIGAETSPGSGKFGQRRLRAYLKTKSLPTQTSSVCGSNGVLVHYAYLTEDDARDDDTDLSTFVRPPR